MVIIMVIVVVILVDYCHLKFLNSFLILMSFDIDFSYRFIKAELILTNSLIRLSLMHF